MAVSEQANLFELDRAGMAALFRVLDEAPYRADQVLRWLHRQGVRDVALMSNLSKALREKLLRQTIVEVPEVVSEQQSLDGTRKWLLKLNDGSCIETVYIPEEERGTLCVSSQVGCALACSFCSTGHQGFSRNLTLGEIVAQVWHARRMLGGQGLARHHAITNVVFMGMGEPLLNLGPVAAAVGLLGDDSLYGIAPRRITLSTAGVVPAMDRLQHLCDANLAVSLHAPDDALRNVLVPLNRKFPINELIEACRRYASARRRCRITFEYAMLAGVNDNPAQARCLVKLLRGVPAKINLIPFNPFPGAEFRCSTPDAIERFREVLLGAGLVTVTRKTRGGDIDAACGQLVGDFRRRTRLPIPAARSHDQARVVPYGAA